MKESPKLPSFELLEIPVDRRQQFRDVQAAKELRIPIYAERAAERRPLFDPPLTPLDLFTSLCRLARAIDLEADSD